MLVHSRFQRTQFRTDFLIDKMAQLKTQSFHFQIPPYVLR